MSRSIKIHILHCGQVQVDTAILFNQNAVIPLAYTGIFRSRKYQVIVPVSVYLIEHPKGLILIDTGWHTDMRGNQLRILGPLHYMINKPILPEGQAVSEQLSKRGIKPSDIDYVFISHFHTDHISGLKLVSSARSIMTSEEELTRAQRDRLRYVHHMWKGVNIETFHMSPSGYGPCHRSFDLFGDDSVVFVHVPGHTPGLTATLIKGNGKFVLLTSDCGYGRKSWEQMILPGVVVNRKQFIESLLWVGNMAKESNCLEVVANHDTEIVPHTIEV
jgi:glyoxylase-like metal-dependent hydrolase (beta-lactamase superfamily II)